jgi:gamma-glutamyl-gamma-aminobutyrate hydrolase PuuD
MADARPAGDLCCMNGADARTGRVAACRSDPRIDGWSGERGADAAASVMRPLVAISAVPRDVPTEYSADRADTVTRPLVRAVVRAGGVPVALPVVGPSLAVEQVALADALVLAGGQDLSGGAEPPVRRVGWVDPARDWHERALALSAMERGVPILGICRGLQLVNVACGGRLAPHIDGHDARAEYSEQTHPLTIEPGSRLAAAVARSQIEVNTIHHQAVTCLGGGLRASAWSADGVIEAAESAASWWFVGVQWHPELMLDRPGGQDIFDALVAAAAAARAGRWSARPGRAAADMR